jgi:hypothetical protein
MANAYSADDLLEFLDHAGDKGLMPAATAFYLNCPARHEVDHIIWPDGVRAAHPCAMHYKRRARENLQYLPLTANRRKGNRT